MANIKVRIGNRWLTVGGGGGSSSSSGAIKDEIQNNILNQVQQILGDLTGNIEDLEEYIDNAFKDGVLSEVERQKLLSYLNIVLTSYTVLVVKYEEIYANTYLKTSRKVGLKTSKDHLDQQYANLRQAIETAIEDSIISGAEDSIVDTAFDNFNDALSTLTLQLEQASREIWEAMQEEAENNSYNYTDAIKEALDKDIEEINDSMNALDQNVDETKDYIDGAFKDGIISMAEAKAIRTYLNVIKTSYNAMCSEYSDIHDNSYLTPELKEELAQDKNSLDVAFSNLINAITSAINDDLASEEEINAVDIAFTNFELAHSNLAHSLQVAINAIMEAIGKEATDNANKYTDDSVAKIQSVVRDVEASVEVNKESIKNRVTKVEFNKYFSEQNLKDSSFYDESSEDLTTDYENMTTASTDLKAIMDSVGSDGIIYDTELPLIQDALTILEQNFESLVDRYVLINAFEELSTTEEERIMEEAYNDFMIAHAQLKTYVNQIISDQLLSVEELTTFNIGYENYIAYLDYFFTTMDSALLKVAEVKMELAMSEAQEYVNLFSQEIDSIIEAMEESNTKADEDITASLLYTGDSLTDELRAIIESHRSTIETQYNQLHGTLEELYNNEFLLDGTGKVLLGTKINELESRYTRLDNSIDDILTSPYITHALRQEFETAMSLYKNAITNCKKASVVALDEIKNGKVEGVESLADYYAEQMRQEAEKYADELKVEIDSSIDNVSDSLTEATEGINAIRNSSAMQEVMRLQLSQYLRSLGNVVGELTEVYNGAMNSSNIDDNTKANLTNLKKDMDNIYTELSNNIGDALTAVDIEVTIYNEVTENLSVFEDSARTLSEALYEALNIIIDQLEADYINTRNNALDNVLDTLENQIIDQRETLEAQSVGTILTAEELANLNTIMDNTHSAFTSYSENYSYTLSSLENKFINSDEYTNAENLFNTLNEVESSVNTSRIEAGSTLNVDSMKTFINSFSNYRAVANTFHESLSLMLSTYKANKAGELNTHLTVANGYKDAFSVSLGGFANPILTAYEESVVMDIGNEYLEGNLEEIFSTTSSNLGEATTHLRNAYNEVINLNTVNYPNAVSSENLTNLQNCFNSWNDYLVTMDMILTNYSNYLTVETFTATGGAYDVVTQLQGKGEAVFEALLACLNDIETLIETTVTNEIDGYQNPLNDLFVSYVNLIKDSADEAMNIYSDCYISDDVIEILNGYTAEIDVAQKALTTIITEASINNYISSELKNSLQTKFTEYRDSVRNCVDGVSLVAEDSLVYAEELDTSYNNLLTIHQTAKESLIEIYSDVLDSIAGYMVSDEMVSLRERLDNVFITFNDDITNTIKALATMMDIDANIDAQLDQLKLYLGTLESTYIDLIARYNQTYRNSYLSKEFADTLESVKKLLDGTYTEMVKRITDAIENEDISSEELTMINYAISDFNVQVDNMSRTLLEALDNIEENRAKGIKIGGRNLITNSTFRDGIWAKSHTVEILETVEGADGEEKPFKTIEVVEEIDYANLASIYDWVQYASSTSIEINVNTLTVQSSAQHGGIYQTAGDLGVEANKNYILSYDIKKVGGTLTKIGGHIDTGTFNQATFISVDGETFTNSYSGGYEDNKLDDGNWHRVVVYVATASSITKDHKIYIQPNRAIGKYNKAMITNIQLSEAESYSKYALSFKDNTTIMDASCSQWDDRLEMTEWTQAKENTTHSAILDRIGYTVESLDIMESNRFEIKDSDRTVSFSANVKIANFEDYDEHTLFWVNFYHDNDIVQRKYITIEDMGLEAMTNDSWYRIGYTCYIGDTKIMDIFSKEFPNGCSLTIMGTKNGCIEVKEVKAEIGDRWTEWTNAPEDEYSVMIELAGRVSNVEQLVTDDSIIDIVTSSYTFENYFNGLAKTTDLSNYMTNENAQNALQAMKEEIDKQFNAQDYMTPYDVESMLERKADEITAKFAQTGGINLLHNSVGFADTDFWTVDETYEGIIGVEQGLSALHELGSGCAFVFNGDIKMWQSINKWYGHYVMSAYVYTDDPDAHITIKCNAGEHVEDTNPDITYEGYMEWVGSTGGEWKKLTDNMNDNERCADIIIESTGDDVYLTCLIVHLGQSHLLWTTAPDELYNSAVQMSISGIRVLSGNDGDYVAITPREFSGYSVVADEETGNLITEKVFTLNKDTTEVSKLLARKEIQLGTMKAVRVQTDDRKGVAFIQYNDD